MYLPVELLDKIVLLTGDSYVANALKNYISDYVYNKLNKNILIYGNVQGGKTAKIIESIRQSPNELKVLVVQNSLLVLEQYKLRFKAENIDFQVITKDTVNIKSKLLVVINNKFRYTYLQNLLATKEKFILYIDEADQIITKKYCSIPKELQSKAKRIYHITATPFKTQIEYDDIQVVEQNKNYYGINELLVTENNNIPVDEFLQDPTGIMLINRFSTIVEMKGIAHKLSRKYPLLPIVLLTTEKELYTNGKITKLKEKNISKIIDKFLEFKHIIFIANRLSNRGLSYVSSDYTRHLTYQVTKVRNNIVSCLQSLRILGIYYDKPTLKLIIREKNDEQKINDTKTFQKYLDFLNSYK
jgi:hypothetical protein